MRQSGYRFNRGRRIIVSAKTRDGENRKSPDSTAEIGDRCFVTAVAAPDVGHQPFTDVGRDGLLALAGGLGDAGE